MDKLKIDDYQEIVNDIHNKYEDDMERLDSAKHIMSDKMYMKYLLQTLQRKSFIESAPYVGGEESEKPTVTFRLQDVDNFIRAILFMNEHGNEDISFGYVKKKSKNFIYTLMDKLYN